MDWMDLRVTRGIQIVGKGYLFYCLLSPFPGRALYIKPHSASLPQWVASGNLLASFHCWTLEIRAFIPACASFLFLSRFSAFSPSCGGYWGNPGHWGGPVIRVITWSGSCRQAACFCSLITLLFPWLTEDLSFSGLLLPGLGTALFLESQT